MQREWASLELQLGVRIVSKNDWRTCHADAIYLWTDAPLGPEIQMKVLLKWNNIFQYFVPLIWCFLRTRQLW